MDEQFGFEVGHGGGDLDGEVEEDGGGEVLVLRKAQVVEEVAVGHEFGYDVVGGLAGADA